MSSTTEKFDLWCIVELFGHQKIAGKCTEQNIAGVNMLRVDVPETPNQPPFTKFYGGSAIYAINPVTEEVAKHMADKLDLKPIHVWDIQEINKKAALALPTHSDKTVIMDPEFEDE